MKDIILSKTMNVIKEQYNYDFIKLKEIRYGLETLYITITKMTVLFICAFLLNIFKELIYLIIFYGMLRITGFGVHAKKSLHCWISSLLTFLLIPYLIKVLAVDKTLWFVMCFILIILIFIYAPADTEKRPLINKRKRNIYKIICTVTSIIYVISAIYIDNSYFNNIVLFSIFTQVIIMLPVTYKLFGVKYNNYKDFERR